jgi:hypothetical protein
VQEEIEKATMIASTLFHLDSSTSHSDLHEVKKIYHEDIMAFILSPYRNNIDKIVEKYPASTYVVYRSLSIGLLFPEDSQI